MKIQAITGINKFNYGAKATPNKNNSVTQTNTATLPSYKDAINFVNMNFNINFKGRIHDCASEGDTEGVLNELNNGVNIDEQDKDGWTALMKASKNGRINTVKELIQNGADVNAQDENGNAVLILASRHGFVELVKDLIKKGADVNAQRTDGWSALMEACDAPFRDVAKELIKNGADVNAQDENGNAALILASNHGLVNLVKDLIKNGADVNAQRTDGWSALMVASNGWYDVAEALLNAGGIDVLARNINGETASIIARRGRWKKAERILLNYMNENGCSVTEAYTVIKPNNLKTATSKKNISKSNNGTSVPNVAEKGNNTQSKIQSNTELGELQKQITAIGEKIDNNASDISEIKGILKDILYKLDALTKKQD